MKLARKNEETPAVGYFIAGAYWIGLITKIVNVWTE